MTTNEMSCVLFNDTLLAYLEHETDDATRVAVERHSVTCAECGALLADLRKLRIDAANLPEMQPSRDLWAGIASRIEAPVVSIGVKQPEVKRALNVRLWTRRALIAASLMAAAGVGYGGARLSASGSRPADPVATLADTPIGTVAESPSIADSLSLPTRQPRAESTEPRAAVLASATPARSPEMQSAILVVNKVSADYDREIARLQKLIDERRNQLDPVTVGIIEKNLKVIDTAITECKKAIANDPASGFLIESLNQSLRSKVELMRTAALLPSRTS